MGYFPRPKALGDEDPDEIPAPLAGLNDDEAMPASIDIPQAIEFSGPYKLELPQFRDLIQVTLSRPILGVIEAAYHKDQWLFKVGIEVGWNSGPQAGPIIDTRWIKQGPGSTWVEASSEEIPG